MNGTISDTLELLIDFQCTATACQLQQIFGPTLGAHLWGQLVATEFNLLAFYNRLDTGNAERLVAHLVERQRLEQEVLA